MLLNYCRCLCSQPLKELLLQLPLLEPAKMRLSQYHALKTCCAPQPCPRQCQRHWGFCMTGTSLVSLGRLVSVCPVTRVCSAAKRRGVPQASALDSSADVLTVPIMLPYTLPPRYEPGSSSPWANHGTHCVEADIFSLCHAFCHNQIKAK